ncbi:PRC-barrel domain-containing protein [Paracoccus sp. Ld10]|uniref:PRC-barrel domain-containing protein n=1 Tax=Paracoccus sp. Ld10 TaxID=649158 RepID=UPI00386BA01E
MRKLLLTTTLALPLTLGAAFAQDTAPAADPAMDPVETAPMTETATPDMAADDMATDDADDSAAAASAAEKVEVQQAENEWRLDWITGTSVMSPDGADIGSISDLIVDSETGEMKAAIIGVGGFLGIGQKQIALPWADLTVNSDAQEITSDLTREEADAAPEYVFRDQEAPAGDMMSDPAADPAMAPAADPMAAEPADPMATEPADPMADPMATEPADDMMTEPTGDMTTEPAPAN